MHHARSFAVVLNSASGVSSSVLLLADKAVELMRVPTRSSVEPSAMFFRRASPPFYLSYFYSIYFPPVDLLLSVSRCSSFRTRDIPCSLILPWTHPITCCLVDSWTCAS